MAHLLPSSVCKFQSCLLPIWLSTKLRDNLYSVLDCTCLKVSFHMDNCTLYSEGVETQMPCLSTQIRTSLRNFNIFCLLGREECSQGMLFTKRFLLTHDSIFHKLIQAIYLTWRRSSSDRTPYPLIVARCKNSQRNWSPCSWFFNAM